MSHQSSVARDGKRISDIKTGSKPVTGYIDEVTSVLPYKYLFIEYDNYI